MPKLFLSFVASCVIAFSVPLYSAEIRWAIGFLDADEDVSNFGEVVEAYAFTGELDRNALPDTFPLEEPFDVNGTMFVPLNFSLGDAPEALQGLTYLEGEFGHTEADEGFGGLIGGLAFESGVGSQIMEIEGLTVGQGYQVEFYYHHRTADRSVTFDDLNGNQIVIPDGGAGIGGIASGYFVADDTIQEIMATANTGSQYLSGYQLRKVPGPPPIIEPPESIPDLVGYWNFDDNVDDLSGNGNHGTIAGSASYDDDIPAILGAGRSIFFDGLPDSHVQIEHNSMMPATSHRDFTISMWVRGDGTIDNVDDRVFSEGSSTNTNPLFNLGTQNEGLDGRFDFYYRYGSTTGHQYSIGEPFDDEWHHLLWVDRNNIGTLYIDGEEDTTFDYQMHPAIEADITSIGSVLRATDCCNFTGNIDDVAIWSFALDEVHIAALATGASPLTIPVPSDVLGDFNGDGLLTAIDIDLLTQEVILGNHPPKYDLDNDGLVDQEDRRVWVEDVKYTYFGDANLDLQFDTADFVLVLGAGKYETGQTATWEDGDWDGNGVFGTGDLVIALAGGGYEEGTRPAIPAVPEPSTCVLLAIGLLAYGAARTRR